MIDQMIQLLGLEKLYDSHKYREITNKIEIIFDHFPGLPPYMEVESKSEKKLGLNEENNFTTKDLYFEQYGITKDRKDASLSFINANQILEKFNNILKHQNKFLNKKSETNIYSIII